MTREAETQSHIRAHSGRQHASTPDGDRLQRTNRKLSSVRSRVEHVFRVIKCQFGYRKTRYRGLAKNAAQVFTLVGLANLYRVRQGLMA